MDIKKQKNSNWRITWSNSSFESQHLKYSCEEVLSHIEKFHLTLKDDKRSLVKRGDLFGLDVVAKKPRDKDRRKSAQFLSLFRSSEALATLNTLSKFSNNSIPSVTPICALEKVRLGMVIDSWLIYEFKDGQIAGADRLPDILNILNQLHQQGYRHDDPHLANFLVDDKNELFLIDCKGKSRISSATSIYDFMLLSERYPQLNLEDILSKFGYQKNPIGRALANFYCSYKNTRSKIKQKFRQLN